MSELQNRIVGDIGRKGTGKSTLLEQMLETRDRVIIFDPLGEHTWTPNELDSTEALKEFFKWNRKRATWAANFVPGDDLEADLEELSRLVYDRGECALGVEEIPLIASANHMPATFGKLVRTGRHRKVDVFWTAQRAAEVPRTLTSLTDEFIFFSQTEPRDLDAIAARCGADVADRVSKLGRHDHIQYDVAKRQLVGASEPAADPPQATNEPQPSIRIIQ